MAIVTVAFLYIVSIIFSDYIIPTWESDQFIQTAASLSFFNLIFRSTLLIIYSNDRCDFESQVLRYFKAEEDMLWIWFKYLVYQMILFRIFGYLALYIQANNQFKQKSFKKLNFFNKLLLNKRSQLNQLEKIIPSICDESQNIENTQIRVENDFHDENRLNTEQSSKTFAIAWNNLSYSKETVFNKKIILKNLYGKIDFGTITALMGPSGSGKTTLLKCIYGMKRSGLSFETQFYVNKLIKIKSIFIAQQHNYHLLMNLTVRESLKYSSLLKNTNYSTRNLKTDSTNEIDYKSTNNLEQIFLDEIEFDHNTNIDKILSDLMLINCADNFVSQCSGGEQKRLAIGLELTPRIKPNFICIDEPTTGLDSYAAEQVIQII